MGYQWFTLIQQCLCVECDHCTCNCMGIVQWGLHLQSLPKLSVAMLPGTQKTHALELLCNVFVCLLGNAANGFGSDYKMA